MRFFFLFIFLSFFTFSYSQNLNLNLGYGLGRSMLKQSFERNTRYYYNTLKNAVQEEVTTVYGSLGAGHYYTLGIEYVTKKDFILGLNVNYLNSNKIKSKIQYDFYTGTETLNLTEYAKCLSFNPYLGINNHIDNKNQFSIKFGLQFMKGIYYVENFHLGEHFTPKSRQTTIENYNGIDIGYDFSFEFSHKLTNTFTFVIGAKYSTIQFTPTKGEVVKNVLDSENELDNLTTSERYFEYHDQITHSLDNDNIIIEEDKPRKFNSYTLPFQATLLFVKIKINLINKSKNSSSP